MASQPIPMEKELVLPAPPQALWPLLSNTSRMNRALGLPAMKVAGTLDGYARRVHATLYGVIPLSWIEQPFEWSEGRFYRAVREFESGPVQRFEGGMELRPTPDGKGTVLRITSNFTPRNAVGDLLVRYATGKKALADAEAIAREIAQKVCADPESCFPGKRTKTPVDNAAFAAKAAALKASPAEPRVVERVIAHLSGAHDDELAHMRPFELADRWGFERLETLRVFLYAVKAGLLDLSWEILCPNCTGGSVAGGLSQLKEKSHCPSCNIEYGLNLCESVELRFAISQSVRPVERALFCVGNPARTPFAVAQVSVEKGKPRRLEADLAFESYTLRSLGCRSKVKLRPKADGPSALKIDFAALGDVTELDFKPGPVTIDVTACALGIARVEREAWKEKAAHASLVTSLQEFRDLFSAEVLAPGIDIAVKNITLLFSDLKGSTALYEKVGDATAYAIVRDHFDYLFDIVKRRRGAVVKTIGDAVMAAFYAPGDALEAALEMQERVAELNAKLAPKPSVILKLGVHQGPVIAINADGVLDYFGTTVNVAARVQNESVGGDVVITEEIHDEPSTAKLLAAHGAAAEPFELRLKGLSECFRLWRLSPKARA